MIPDAVVPIPDLRFIRQVGMLDIFQRLVASLLLLALFSVYCLHRFIQGTNREFEVSAKLDGASSFVIGHAQTPQGMPDLAVLMAGAGVSMAPTLNLIFIVGRKAIDLIQRSGS